MKNIERIVLAIITIVVIATSCNKQKNSKLEIRLTDAPLAVEEVNVDLVKVQVKFDDDSSAVHGWQDLQTNTGVYDLLNYQNGVNTLIASGSFPQQIVKEVRLVLGTNNTVKDNGQTFPLTIPSGAESGLKIKVDKKLQLTLETLIIDFDAALSVKKESDGLYKLRPVCRLK